jgi:hypothetical protein
MSRGFLVLKPIERGVIAGGSPSVECADSAEMWGRLRGSPMSTRSSLLADRGLTENREKLAPIVFVVAAVMRIRNVQTMTIS